ncbi:hypothetical protein [Streptomyces cavernae]|uniref:hypothetical protein n=1 Tax=Streptomyces cavernae TaxID=2259034 RepID=UPI000FEC1F3C|nr:hypothetical protein [Streptomyces cavernae]
MAGSRLPRPFSIRYDVTADAQRVWVGVWVGDPDGPSWKLPLEVLNGAQCLRRMAVSALVVSARAAFRDQVVQLRAVVAVFAQPVPGPHFVLPVGSALVAVQA